MEKLFVPHELKTIEVDVEKKIFKVNGEDFGNGCSSFRISCIAGKGWEVKMDIETSVRLIGYNSKGKKESDHTYDRHPKTSSSINR